MPLQTAHDQIETLVKKFKGLSTRARQAYNEADTRKDFILPLFRAMEWNIDDMREVAAEEKISRGFVDFSFRINGVRRFVLETKRIGEDLSKTEFARQTIDYAYHKGVTWAVLSDFEGLKLFNAEAREANPFQAQFKEFGVDDYLPRLDELWWLSRPAILEGVLDREAERVFKKVPRQPIAQALFDNLMEWRKELYKNLREYNHGKIWTAKQIDDAVQHILDRLIFVRTAEDRLVEGEKLIALVRENPHDKLLPALKRRFRELDDIYNSQLFRNDYVDDLDLGEPATIAKIIEGLDHSSANMVHYNFALIDADVLGRVYEQYLGTVLSEREELEAKTAKRKSQGIYYTPTFVVKYIVQQTLGKYIEERGYNAARTVRVLDPACGSGSFLIEAFDVLDQFLARESGQSHGANDVRDYARHLQILTSNIYGVDKDEQAVEVAQLNLLLKALHVPDKLPKLVNIRQGDSLISGTPKELEEYFGADWQKRNPFNWNEQFRAVMEDGGFDVIVGNPPYVRIQTLPKDDVEFFNKHYAAATGNYDIYVLFVERALELLKPGGVFGMILPKKFFNTDYGKGLRKLIADAKTLWKVVDFGDAQVFEEATTYTCLLFLQRQANTQTAYVNAADWLRADSATTRIMPTNLAEHMIETASISEKEWNFSPSESGALLERLSAFPEKLGDIVEKIAQGLVTSADQVYILEERAGSTKRLVSVHSRATEKTYRLEREVVVPLLKGALDMRRYRIESVTRYVVFPYKDGSLISAKDFAARFPNCWAYLKENRKTLTDREHGKMEHEGWHGYVYPKNLKMFAQPKILTPAIANRASFSYDEHGEYYFVGSGGGGGGGYGITLKPCAESVLYILGLLNSRLLDFYLKSISSPFRQGYYAYNKQYIERLPIRRINFADTAEKQQHDKIVARVDEMLQLQKDYAATAREKLPKADALKRRIDEVDAEIDQIVYQLYGLTEEEIRVVEGRLDRETRETTR